MWQRNYVVLPSGERVRYALIERPNADTYYIRFKGPDGKRVTLGTGRKKKPEANSEAHRLILEQYGAPEPSLETVTWELAKEKLSEGMEADGKRPKTIKGYLETLDKLIPMFTRAKGPADISDKMAEDFKTKYDRGRFTRRRVVEDEKAPEYVRKKKSLDSRIRTLKAVFSWFKRLRLIDDNPFEKVAAPEMDRHEVKYVSEGDVTHFFSWLEQRFPNWQMPRLFFTVKAVTGCRLEDICSLKSSQLQDGRLIFTADTTKNRSERYAILPADLYAELETYKGDTYLWERYPGSTAGRAPVPPELPTAPKPPTSGCWPGPVGRWLVRAGFGRTSRHRTVL